MFDDLFAKSATILSRLGASSDSQLGDVIMFSDSLLTLESYRNGGLHMRIGYADTGKPAVELWRGALLTHPGDHAILLAYVLAVFTALVAGR